MKILPAVLFILFTAQVHAESAPVRDELKGEFVMDFIIDTTPPQLIGERTVVPITGGRFEGPNLQGTVLNVGADWIKARADGTRDLDVRVTLKTDDEALIYMSYKGIISRSEQGMYWRVVPVFETDASKYDYLTKMISVGIGKRIDGKTAYSIYRVL